ncbi:S-methyl-5-thioribose-1-phosphate isomerase [Thermotoga sp. KOL6]|uniref:S-methyl-5-thioribose-1-phosphate isomerase n=1 Tax=Thermotoga sp. KOL6 TaxID=126741 RepID=UPI000C77ECFF|nr:S-methyl-5-thioribose-1-phosphate isomerase [Thermotoga sp. KOL6]PLV58389.1 methylthioribose-1-phosphate isomerase [Thermotoga sp. KOL6]
MKLKTKTMEWTGQSLKLLDQRKLPFVEEYVECRSHKEVAHAIKEMIVRGAPAIGVTAAFGYVLGYREFKNGNLKEWMEQVKYTLSQTRPTAVNLFWALNRMEKVFLENINEKDLDTILENEAMRMAYEDIETNKAIGKNGAELIKDGSTVLTHCNAGALATVDYGTALGVIRAAVESGKRVKVFADETRPYLQGARLTAWELMKDGIEVYVITDNMAGWLMKRGLIDAVVVGADRIALNGDTANKIGTYSLAVLAHRNNIPFYIAAPVSTIDPTIKSGKEIPIEERKAEEVTHCGGSRIVPEGVKVLNPAFDVTENSLITAIITEKGVVKPPFEENIKKILEV